MYPANPERRRYETVMLHPTEERRRQERVEWARMQVDRSPEKVIARCLRREVRQFGGLFESRIPLMSREISETLEYGKPKRKEHE